MSAPDRGKASLSNAHQSGSSHSILVEDLGKRFRRRVDRPSTLKEAVLRWRFGSGNAESFWGLTGVNFRVSRGSMLGVIGRNGAGKSTLLRLIGGVGKPDVGRISTHGRVGALLELGAGFHPDLSGRENAMLLGVISGLTRREVGSRFESMVAFAELERFIDAPLRTYSSGMTLRLAFAVAAHTDPDILLIDEVLAVGDLGFQRKCVEKIREIQRAGAAIVLVTHDIDQVKRYCDQALWLDQGRVAAFGASSSVAHDYTSELARASQRLTPRDFPNLALANGRTLKVGHNRFGSLDLKICAVTLYDAAGRIAHELTSGESLTVDLDLSTSIVIQSPVVCVSIRNESKQTCLDANTESEQFDLGTVTGQRRLRLIIERLDLAGGNYVVNVGVYERGWAYAYDEHSDVYSFAVRPTPGAKAVLAPPLRWALDETAAENARARVGLGRRGNL